MTIPSVSIGSRGMVRRCSAGVALIGLSLLAGCVAPPTASSESASGDPVVNAPVTTTGTRDHVTQSDETDASRRARVRLELAGAYFGRGQMTTALDEVKKSIAADPNVSAAFNLRGLIYGSLGDHRLAEESFRQALRIDPRDADSMQNFGWYLCQQSRFVEAHALFLQALAIPQYQDSPRTLLTQGICEARSGKIDEAERTLSRAYALDPGNPAIAVNLSEVLYRKGDLERARFYIRRVNSVANLISPQTLWLAARIENKFGNPAGVADFGGQLRSRFPESQEANSYAEGRFNE